MNWHNFQSEYELCPIFAEELGNTDSEKMLNPLNRFTNAGLAPRQAGKPKTCREVYGIPGPTAHRPRRDRPAAAEVGSRPKTRYLRCVRKREMTPMETEEKVLHNSMAVGSMGFK